MLVNRELSGERSESKLRESKEMIQISPFIDFIYDVEKIAIGAYSPLDGFMDSSTMQSVITRSRLLNDLPWTIPILLAPKEEDVKSVKEGDEVALLDWNGSPFAILETSEKFSYSKEELAKAAYGTTYN